MKRILILFFSCVSLCAAAAPAQTNSPAKSLGPAEDLTVITSDRLTFDYKKHYALFESNVFVTDPQMKLASDKMTVTFDESNKVQNIRAEGNVKILQEDKVATSDLATYDVTSGEIILTGNPKVTRGQDVLTGRQITFWRDQNRMRVDNGATLYLQNAKDANKGDLLGGPKRGK